MVNVTSQVVNDRIRINREQMAVHMDVMHTFVGELLDVLRDDNARMSDEYIASRVSLIHAYYQNNLAVGMERYVLCVSEKEDIKSV